MAPRQATTPSPSPASSKLDGATHRKTEKERQLDLQEKGRKRAGEEPDRKKAWSSINHSMLSDQELTIRKIKDRTESKLNNFIICRSTSIQNCIIFIFLAIPSETDFSICESFQQTDRN